MYSIRAVQALRRCFCNVERVHAARGAWRLLSPRRKVRATHIKAHSGHPWNEMVDVLATEVNRGCIYPVLDYDLAHWYALFPGPPPPQTSPCPLRALSLWCYNLTFMEVHARGLHGSPLRASLPVSTRSPCLPRRRQLQTKKAVGCLSLPGKRGWQKVLNNKQLMLSGFRSAGCLRHNQVRQGPILPATPLPTRV